MIKFGRLFCRKEAEGLSMRDTIALRCLEGMIIGTDGGVLYPRPESGAYLAYRYADAMIEERKKDLKNEKPFDVQKGKKP